MLEDYSLMADSNSNVVSASSTGPKLPDGVVGLDALEPSAPVDGCRVFTHYNGPTDELSGLAPACACSIRARAHIRRISIPEEEFMIVASGTGEIDAAGKTTQVGPGAMMYCAGIPIHGITNTGQGAADVLLVQVAG